MKTIFILCALILAIGVALVWRGARSPSRFGTFTGAPKAEVADIINRPQDFLHKTVAIEGEIREQCETMGCYFYFFSGKNSLRVDLEEIAMTAPRRNGRPARVEGQIVPYGEGYEFFASAVEFK